jgi:sec-independent protein translocase protein TatC
MLKKKKNNKGEQRTPQPAPSTFHDHFMELKSRLFWVAMYFMLFSGLVYPNFEVVSKLLMAPLGGEHLYYTTPAGGLSFIIKVCMYVGVIATLPVMVYHTYKFILPIMSKARSRSVAVYTFASMILAATGVLFAYLVSLPAAIHFLTNFNINGVSALLTVDSYLSFIIAYLVAGAVLFQLPLFMLMIDGVTPLKPGKLMSYQRHMLVGSFVLAAILSPTPDVVNQTILAAPLVVMYQIGVIIISLRHRSRQKKAPHVHETTVAREQEKEREQEKPALVLPSKSEEPPRQTQSTFSVVPARTIDGVWRSQAAQRRPIAREVVVPERSPAPATRSFGYPRQRSIDGIISA